MRALRLALVALCLTVARNASAQEAPPILPSTSSEEIEPRAIATAGTTTVGISGSVDRFQSTEQRYPLNITAHLDVSRFVTSHIAIIAGVTGRSSIGGSESESHTRGLGVPALHAFGGALYYFTPQSMVSLYAGQSYWNQLTARSESDNGAIVGLVGVQAALSSRAMAFVEGGYGAEVSRGAEGEMRTRLLGRIGIRFRF